ncbi:hypothetical protein AB6A40_006709 [Gnathostoma spinigerum]|uniref:Uncharacterized protein n=1 Tax=Gnathostoma spinigerum TaxID=75299 RepID=A0ABD6EJ43_9BILA
MQNKSSGCAKQSNTIRNLRPRLEYKVEEGFAGSDVKKALLESIYEKHKQDHKKELEKTREILHRGRKKRNREKKREVGINQLPVKTEFLQLTNSFGSSHWISVVTLTIFQEI